MQLRTNKQGTLFAVVDGQDYEIFTKGEHSVESITNGVNTLMNLAEKDMAVKEAKAQLEAVRNAPLRNAPSAPSVTSTEF